MSYKTFSDEEIKRNNERILSGFSEVLPRYKKEPTQAKNSDEKLGKAIDILLDIYNRFDVASNQRAKDLGLSAQGSTTLFKFIEKEMFVEVISLNLSGKKGGLCKFHSLTEKGLKLINKPSLKKYSGGTGAKHIFLQKYLKKHLPPLGFKEIEIEKNFEGKRLDLFAKYEELKVGIEICVSTFKTEHLNVIKDIDKCDVVFVTSTDKKSKIKLEEVIYQKIPRHPKVRICVVHELLNASSLKALLENKLL